MLVWCSSKNKIRSVLNCKTLEKYFVAQVSDWDRYAAEEYELLVAEEGGPDHNEDMSVHYSSSIISLPNLP